MKYESKNVGGIAKSVAAGVPWVNLPRGAGPQSPGGAWKACRSLGPNYDLISNDEWQTIAREIADNPWNWDSGILNNGQINAGHVDGLPASILSATTDDLDACNQTLNACPGGNGWHRQRRTHLLPNGGILWDFGGNVSEWVRDNIYEIYGTDQKTYLLTGAAQALFGNDTICASPSGANNQCGFGLAKINEWIGPFNRGASYLDTTTGNAGVFSAWSYDTASAGWLGFRCVFHPPNDPVLCPSTTIGSTCKVGNAGNSAQAPLYLGGFNGWKYMTTAAGCTNSTTPTCNGTPDSVTLKFSSAASYDFVYAYSDEDGLWNEGAIINEGRPVEAASFCHNLIWGGYDDWYLPAPYELILFQSYWAVLGMNSGQSYWTSKQDDTLSSFKLGQSGSPVSTSKATALPVRCVRRYNYNP
jgi:hypothetical protein